VTYGHHSLIYGDRKGALYGSIATVLLAIIFTVFQGVEYNVSSFTISDGAFGTCFFFGTGFHGSIIEVALFIFIYIMHKTQIAANFKISSSSINNNELLITLPNTLTNKPKILPYSLRKEFIE
jgi:heme/copper-type cytochrome/quinol oxidase subunit 3